MASSEPGPELDRRVALLLGWRREDTVYRGRSEEAWRQPGVEFVERPAFSTDPARIAEMVEWLAKRFEGVSLGWSTSDSEWAAAASGTKVWTGQTIQHALALLLVAVGEVGSDA